MWSCRWRNVSFVTNSFPQMIIPHSSATSSTFSHNSSEADILLCFRKCPATANVSIPHIRFSAFLNNFCLFQSTITNLSHIRVFIFLEHGLICNIGCIHLNFKLLRCSDDIHCYQYCVLTNKNKLSVQMLCVFCVRLLISSHIHWFIVCAMARCRGLIDYRDKTELQQNTLGKWEIETCESYVLFGINKIKSCQNLLVQNKKENAK